jgi:hypothetical protein
VIPEGSEAGAWKARMRILDIQGHETSLEAPELETLGFPNSINVEDGIVPTVSSVSPASGTVNGGTPITITGTGFVSGATVEIGQGSGAGPTAIPASDVVVVSPTEITATTGGSAKAGTWNLFVIDSGGTSPENTGDKYTYK